MKLRKLHVNNMACASLLLCAALMGFSLNAQPPSIAWARAIGGSGNDRANGVAVDHQGHVIVVGRFQSDRIEVDGVTLAKAPANPSDAADAFILKLDQEGKAIWATTAGDLGDDHALSCVADKAGNIYVAGYFESETLTLGQVSLKNTNFTAGKPDVRYNSDLWVAKFSPQGTCLWARNAGGYDGNGQYSTIALDAQDNVIVGGIAGAVMDFGKDVKLTMEKGGMYVAKYSNAGDLLWVQGAEHGECHGVGVDPENNIYAGGFFKGRTTLGDVILEAQGGSDAYLVKYGPAGNVLWANQFGGAGGEIASGGTDHEGNGYLAGIFFSDSIPTPSTILRNNGSMNAFIAKYDRSGHLIWARSAGGNNGDKPGTGTREFHVDEKGNVFCTGSNWSAFTFAGQTVKPVAGSEDIFVIQYDRNGMERWGVDFGGAGRNAGRGLTTDRSGDLFLTGSFDEKELRMGGHTLMNAGDSDIFLVKFTNRGR